MAYPDGRQFVGQFTGGKMNGSGKMAYPDGTVEEGSWKDNKFAGAAGITSTPNPTQLAAAGVIGSPGTPSAPAATDKSREQDAYGCKHDRAWFRNVHDDLFRACSITEAHIGNVTQAQIRWQPAEYEHGAILNKRPTFQSPVIMTAIIHGCRDPATYTTGGRAVAGH